MATNETLKIWILQALASLGPAPVPRIAQYIWENHEAKLRS